MTEHTPTPWHSAGRKGGWDGVTSADGTDICHLEYNNPANAAFIVTAVNSHEALVAALRALAANMRDLHHYHVHNTTSGAEVWDELECERHLDAADAALKAHP